MFRGRVRELAKAGADVRVRERETHRKAGSPRDYFYPFPYPTTESAYPHPGCSSRIFCPAYERGEQLEGVRPIPVQVAILRGSWTNQE